VNMEKSELKTEIYQISESSALVEFGMEINEDINKKVRTFCAYLDERPFNGMIEYVPAFASVSIIYNPLDMNSESPYEVVKAILDNIISKLDFSLADEEHIVEIPVCYGGDFGQDIEKIAAPRRESPRTAIPAGSVGIAGMQTGVYPIETPGGWQLIGKTPLKMFDLNGNHKSLLKAGDIAKFYPISYEEYEALKEEE